MENLETPVQKFYNGKSIFMTGGTGFLGKIMMEKLMRTCQVDTIYLLVRDKKGKNIHSRVEDLFDDAVYDRLREHNPKFRHKIHPIAGDCSLPGLGISAHDREVLCKSVNVVFHVAATVRFDEKLNIAMGINVHGTKAILDLCRGMEKLVTAVHISTAYANCNRRDIDEKFYKYDISGTDAMKAYEGLEDEALERIGREHSKDWPNTYTYTKALAEDLIRQESKGLPMSIVRPAIVLPTLKEPIQGWIDNLYGPTGMVVGVGAGLIHVIHTGKANKAELVPVDMCVNAILVCAKDRATREHKEIPIINFVTTPDNKISWRQYIDFAREHGMAVGTMKSIWYPAFTVTDSHIMYRILWFLYHTVPAFFLDICFRLIGRSPKMMDVYRKIRKFTDALMFFAQTKFTFTCTNMEALWKNLTPDDKEIFYFDMTNLDWNSYIRDTIVGTRQYLMKDPPSTIPAALKRQKRFKIIHYFLLYVMYAIMGMLLALLLMKLLLPTT